MPLKGHNVARQAERIFPRIGRRAVKKPGRRSQRKGRRAEFEIRDILKAAGYDAVVKGMYEPGDLLWGLAGRDRLCEVKRARRGMRPAYKAFKAGNHALFFRADDEVWLIVQTVDQYLKDNVSPPFATEKPLQDHPPNQVTAEDIEDVLAALE